MNISFAPIAYRVDCWKSQPEVDGYAIHLPAPFAGLRFCVRQHGSAWTIDHYDSGYSVGGPAVNVGTEDRAAIRHMQRWQIRTESRRACARWLLDYLRHLRRTGGLRSLGDQRWLASLDEAGL